jgi:hypothetical protein
MLAGCPRLITTKSTVSLERGKVKVLWGSDTVDGMIEVSESGT